ncbi:hypothetical protein P872_01300 [Rhodonellum psychrophilum GCM71 = DSM 17998]|uniref:Uncharacterized protein n=1 Tax=Rhodonellum psychrophilum GCM71 = DSM 17998 TaxID=1123057 RepID=U5C2A7_9BACT|nr:hypothetical protein P872_01300 [Rhodonellum psychrophilum GCM71 = DSM 17998]
MHLEEIECFFNQFQSSGEAKWIFWMNLFYSPDLL